MFALPIGNENLFSESGCTGRLAIKVGCAFWAEMNDAGWGWVENWGFVCEACCSDRVGRVDLIPRKLGFLTIVCGEFGDSTWETISLLRIVPGSSIIVVSTAIQSSMSSSRYSRLLLSSSVPLGICIAQFCLGSYILEVFAHLNTQHRGPSSKGFGARCRGPLVAAPQIPLQTRPLLWQRLQVGLVSSHLTRRALYSGFSVSDICRDTQLGVGVTEDHKCIADLLAC